MKPSTACSVLNVVDGGGRFVILNVTIDNLDLELVNVYGHHFDRDDLFLLLKSHVDNYNWNSIIWGGDLNFVRNIDPDKIGGLPQTNFTSRAKMLHILQKPDLINIWRKLNPKSKYFT